MKIKSLLAALLAGVSLSGCALLQREPPEQSSAPSAASPSSPASRPSPSASPPLSRQTPPPAQAAVPLPKVEAAPAPSASSVQRQVPPAVELKINESEEVSKLISYVQDVASQSADEQRRELAGLNRSLARDQGLLPRLRLALLLGTPGTAVHDDLRALGLLDALVGGSTAANAGALRRFAVLLHVQVAERVREQKRAVQLREQLDALKAMERSLIRRSQGRNR